MASRFTKALQWAKRGMATTATEAKKPYPFSKTALIQPEPAPAPEGLRKGKGLMPYLHKTLPTPEKQALLQNLFGKHSPNRLWPGSILSVTLEHSPGTFTGVLLSIRRRGPDTSFVLRNVIQRSGVEMQFFPNSPHVKEIKVLRKPPGGRMKRAKLFYLRDSPEKMSALAASKK
jgi:large subunit ribosomal protein L19